jgi:hypothetical protein
VDDGETEAAGLQMREHALQDSIRSYEVVEDVNESNDVEGISFEGCVFVEHIGNHSLGNVLDSLVTSNGDRLEPVKVLETLRPSNLQEEADVAADIEKAVLALDVRSGEPIIARHGPSDVVEFVRDDV